MNEGRLRQGLLALLTCAALLSGAFADDYFVAPLGNGDGSSPEEAMGIQLFQQITFAPGDHIYFLSDQGPYRRGLLVDGSRLSGSAANPIRLSGYLGNATFDLSHICCHSSGAPVLIYNANYIELNDISARGNGSSSAFLFINSGNAGEGFTVSGTNLKVLSNTGPMLVDHDGFDASFNSQIELHSPFASGTRPFDFSRGSHQSITAHGGSEFIVYGAEFEDTNYWAVPVDSSSITFYGGRYRDAYVGSFAIGSNGTQDSFIKVLDSDTYPTDIEIDVATMPKSDSRVSSEAHIEIDGGYFAVRDRVDEVRTDLLQTINRGKVVIKNTKQLIIDSNRFRYLGHNGSVLELTGNKNVLLDSANSYYFRADPGAVISLRQNYIVGSGNESLLFSGLNGSEKLELISNILKLGDDFRVVRVEYGSVDHINIFQNEIDGAKSVLDLKRDEINASIINNDFKNVATVVSEFNVGLVSHNNFQNTSGVGTFQKYLDTDANSSALFGQGLAWWADSSPLGIDGQEFGSIPNIGAIAGGALLRQEAEEGQLSGRFVLGSEASANPLTYAEVVEGAGNPGTANLDRISDWIDFNFFVSEPGLYRVQGVARAPHSGSDSFWLKHSDALAAALWAPRIGSDFEVQDVFDRISGMPLEQYFDVGEVEYRLYLREDGTQIDSLALYAVQDGDLDGVSDEYDACPVDSAGFIDSDGDGLCDESDPYPNDPLNGGDILLEAEQGVLSGQFEILNLNTASGGGFVRIANGAGNDISGTESLHTVELSFYVSQAGSFRLQASAFGLNGEDDSFWLQIDDQPNRILWDLPRRNSFVESTIYDRGDANPVEINLDAGHAKLTVYLREDGANLDWIELVRQ